MKTQIEKWNLYEIELEGPADGNPFVDVELSAVFTNVEQKEDTVEVDGFYDGAGIYRVRFMPETEGTWVYETRSNTAELNGQKGTFECISCEDNEKNHGPVRVRNKYHFAYADGTEFYPFGTTCYAWIHQPEKIQMETLATLSQSCFNKLRMCVFPKFYSNNSTEPYLYPYEGQAPDHWDVTRFNPEFFQHLEDSVEKLQNLGIEVDLILFHPYDKGHWGFDRMSHENDLRYLKYLIARIASFRNVWWSLANEYDYMEKKTKADWDDFLAFVANKDPYHHLLSIHQGDVLYDHWDPKITHASIQLGTHNGDVELGFGVYKAHRDIYQKPVIYDEVGYEGNLMQRWGSLSAQEVVDKYWKAAVSGVYMSHGETFQDPKDLIWWAKGGILKGESPARIAFLKNIIAESGTGGLEPLDHWWILNGAGCNGQYYLFYFGSTVPMQWKFQLPAFKTPEIPMGTRFAVDVIDTWNMTVTRESKEYEITDKDRYHYTCAGQPFVEGLEKPYMAIRIQRL